MIELLKRFVPLFYPVLWIILGISWIHTSSAQQPLIHLTFSEGDQAANKKIIDPVQALYSVDLMRQQFSTGVKDLALDLSEDAMHRRPWVLDSISARKIDLNKSFSVQVWVKTKPGARQGTPIMGNKKHDELTATGWQLSTGGHGAWSLNLSDGENQYIYEPTRRQAINDGLWHQIVFTVERPKNEARMYFDGELVAIYNLGSLGDLSNELRTIAGGSDEYFEYGSEGQWTAFNGFLDEVKMWDRVMSAQQVKQEWLGYFPQTSGSAPQVAPEQLKVMTWNIWHGGRRYGEQVGVQRTIDIIQDSQSDVILMIETYGSGAIIADALGYYFYLISSNLSIMSRYPIRETIEAFRSFNFGGALIELAPGNQLVLLDTWLHYLPDYMKSVTEGTQPPEELIKDEGETRASEIADILKEIEPLLDRTDVRGFLMAGDFNSGSHLDWIPSTKGLHNDYIVEWPVSKSMIDAGFKDSFRELHIDPLADPGYTWTPRAATSSTRYGIRDRIDYIYYKGDGLSPIYSKVIDYHPIMFPSDHAAVVNCF